MTLLPLFLFLVLCAPLHALPCSDARALQLSSGLLGAYVAQCTDTGAWKPLQCHGSTGHCWCVDSEGKATGPARPATSLIHLDCP